MSSFIPSQEVIGQAFSIAGLALVAPSTYYFRNYSRVLEYAQMLTIFSAIYAANYSLFSDQLGWSILNFMPSFLGSYCNWGEFLCVYGYLISPGVAWFGVALLMLIILSIVGCKNSNVRYHNFYIFWKGFFRWFSVPLAYYCTYQIITSIRSSAFNPQEVNFMFAAIIAIIIVVWMFVELVGHGCVQKPEENNWKKWCDFFSNFRIISIMALVPISDKIDPIAKYFIYGPIVIYDIVFLVKYKFNFKVFERVLFIIQEGVLITLFSLFIFNTQYLFDNNLDLFGLAIVILADLLLFIPKLVSTCKSAEDEEDPAINPEAKTPAKRDNAFQDSITPEYSRGNLKEITGPSPRGKPARR